jgi:hypothetical protein
MAAAKTVKAKLTNAAVILRDDKQVTLQAGEQEVSAAELKLLQAAGLVATDEVEAEVSEGEQQ